MILSLLIKTSILLSGCALSSPAFNMANVAASLLDAPPKVPRLDLTEPIFAQKTLPAIPSGVESDILKYLTFDDLKHQDVFKGNLLIPENSIYQFMGESDFDGPIRHIFRDFDNAELDDGARLVNLKALMKNKNFVRYIEESNSIVELVHSYIIPLFRLDDQVHFQRFLVWLSAQKDSPAKEYILANQNDLNPILSRGLQTLNSKGQYIYHTILPSALSDTFSHLIKRGDKQSADLFDQLVSNQIISGWFRYDLYRSTFQQSIIDMSQSGQTNVFFKDLVFGTLAIDDLKEMIVYFVKNERLDILNLCLKKLHKEDLYEFYDKTVWVIMNLAADPRYNIKLAKDLILDNLKLIKETPYYINDHGYASDIRLEFLKHILSRQKNYRLQAILKFMLTTYRKAGILIKKKEALSAAMAFENHEYDRLFKKKLHDY